MAKEAGTSLAKKYGPLSGKGWALTGLGVGAVYYIYKRIKGGSSSSGSSTGILPSTLLPNGGSTGTGVSTSSGSNLSTYAGWLDGAISALTGGGISGTAAYNAVTNWIDGSCIDSASAAALGAFISANGTPPGIGTTPPISVCSGASTPASGGTTSGGSSSSGSTPASSSTNAPSGPPPNLSSSLIAQMTANGEHIVSTAYDPVYQDWVYLTNKGGIYNLNQQGGQGNGFFGSIFSLPNHNANWFSSSGQQIRTAAGLTINPNGGYTVTDTAGENYTFNPHTAATGA